MRGLNEKDIALTRRRLSREHMDELDIGRSELAESLRFIRMVNKRMGGTKAALEHIKRWSRGWPRGDVGDGAGGGAGVVRILDVGTGSADIPLAIAQWAKKEGHRVEITAVDRHPLTLELAREYIKENGGEGAAEVINFVQADALQLHERFATASFDYAHAGMFLHHLADIEVMTVLRIMDRLTTHGVIWNDLVRGRIEKLAVRWMTRGLPEYLRHDARVSVEAGFTKREAMDLARRVGLETPRWHRHMWGRFTLTSEPTRG